MWAESIDDDFQFRVWSAALWRLRRRRVRYALRLTRCTIDDTAGDANLLGRQVALSVVYQDVVYRSSPTGTTSAFEIKGLDAALIGNDLVFKVYTNYNPASGGRHRLR